MLRLRLQKHAAASGLVLALALALLLGGCDRRKDGDAAAIACPAIAVRDGFEDVKSPSITQENTDVEIRLAGVEARCSGARRGEVGLRLEMFINLLVLRDDDSRLAGFERAPFTLALVFVDEASGAVIARETYRKEAVLKPSLRRSRPVLAVRTKIPPGARVVFALGQAE